MCYIKWPILGICLRSQSSTDHKENEIEIALTQVVSYKLGQGATRRLKTKIDLPEESTDNPLALFEHRLMSIVSGVFCSLEEFFNDVLENH